MLTRLFAIALALPSAILAIDLKPEFFQTHIEQGIYVSEVSLPDGPKRVVYAYPPGWRSSVGETELRFAHPEFLHTTLGIRIAKTATLDEEEMKSRTEWLATFAPKDSTDFTVEKVQKSDLTVSKAPILDLGASYSAFGQKYRMAVHVVYLSTGTLEFVLISPAATFEKALEPVRASLFSLRWESQARSATDGVAKK